MIREQDDLDQPRLAARTLRPGTGPQAAATKGNSQPPFFVFATIRPERHSWQPQGTRLGTRLAVGLTI
jgi:hypothetical protein